MSTLEKMPGHTRLYRRNATYYHRCAVPEDIRGTYGKREETFSLRTKDYARACELVCRKAVEVDQRFNAHRQRLHRERHAADRLGQESIDALTPEQSEAIEQSYYAHLLEEDEAARLDTFLKDTQRDGHADLPEVPRNTFKEHGENAASALADAKLLYATGESNVALDAEVAEVLTWSPVNLNVAEGSQGWREAVRALQVASRRAYEDILKRQDGDVVRTPQVPEGTVATHGGSQYLLLSDAVDSWMKEKRVSCEKKTADDYAHWNRVFNEVCGDRPLDQYSRTDGRAFKSVLLKLPANVSKNRALASLGPTEAAEKADALGLPAMSSSNLNKAPNRVQNF